MKLWVTFGLPVNDEKSKLRENKSPRDRTLRSTVDRNGGLFRKPMEGLQALSFPPTRKYQSDKGPGMVEILKLLNSSDVPAEDQKTFLKAQILFWLIGATDGHAKNFSIFRVLRAVSG